MIYRTHPAAINWAPLNRDLLRMVDEGMCKTRIARRLGVSLGALQRHAAECGLRLPGAGDGA